MHVEPIHKRPYHVFLSHSSKDKELVVDQISDWLENTAGVPVWYDRSALPAGAKFSTVIADSIVRSRSVVIILSKASVASGWVEEEWGLALDHQKQFPRFGVIPIVIDDCEVPGFLASRSHYKLIDGKPDFSFYNALLRSIYGWSNAAESNDPRDVFVSRTWRPSEGATADEICRQFGQSGFRLIGDAEDHPNFTDNQRRVQYIISGTGGLLAILPYRAQATAESGFTSKYVIAEARMAKELGIPYLLYVEKGVHVPADLTDGATVGVEIPEVHRLSPDFALEGIDSLREAWIEDYTRHYVFFASNFEFANRNESIRQLIQSVTAMRCVIGDEVTATARSVQQEIVSRVAKASVVVGDISEPNLNTLIEIGVARGAGVPFLLLAREPRQRPTFMLRDAQVFYYADEVQLLGRVHKLMYPYRRRILNNEL